VTGAERAPPRLEFAAVAEADRFVAAWRDLAARAAPNPFAEPEFLLPALRRLAPGRIRLALVWREATLIGLAALQPPRLRFGMARVWKSEQAALAAALFDRDQALAALGALHEAYPAAAGLLISLVDPAGSLAKAPGAVALSPIVRAASAPGSSARGSAKRRKEARRLERRLAERGALELSEASDAAAIERFLALEASGWKGARGTALAREAERAAFAREFLEGLAERGRLEIFELRVGNDVAAAGAVLRAGRRAFFWKTAYDERYAQFSPGAALARRIGERLAADPGLELVDSCAAPDHPMIDRIWSERLALVDLALPGASAARFRTALALERGLRRWRARLKGAARSWLGRGRS